MCVRANLIDDRLGPGFGGFLVVDVAIDAERESFRAKLLEPAVEPFAGLAIELVGGIAQSQHGKALALKLRCLAPLDKFEEARRRLRRIALAVSADDDQHILFLGELPHLVIGHVGHGASEPFPLRRRFQSTRQLGGIAGFSAIKDRELATRARNGGHGLRGGRSQAGIQPGEITTKPARLCRVERLGERFDQSPLLRGQSSPRHLTRCHSRLSPTMAHSSQRGSSSDNILERRGQRLFNLMPPLSRKPYHKTNECYCMFNAI